jgi:hypothetical protein
MKQPGPGKRWTSIAATAGVGLVALATAQAQQTRSSQLSAADYIQIQQLVNRYPYAVDTGADNGDMYAGLFAQDGIFAQRTGDVSGKDALAATARRFQRGPQSAFHFLMNHVIEPSPEGAVGKEYLVQLVFGENGQPSRIFGGGHYDDVYERTAAGWRFKRRQFIPSQGGFEVTTPTSALTSTPSAIAPAPAGKQLSSLTAADYLEIQQLVARYPYGLDTGADTGRLFSDVFAIDGIFAGGPSKVEGREKLAAFASGHRPGQGPLYARNFSTNVMIRPSGDGAVGKAYAVVLDIGEGTGKPSSVLNGGHYEDTYVRTSEGWRIKSRQFLPSRSGTQPAPIDTPRLPVRVMKAAEAKPATGSSALAPEDYVEIQQVVASYPFALDTGADEGGMYADLFAADGAFVAGEMKIEGRGNLKKFAWQHRPGQGPLYVRNFSTNAIIEPSAGGAVGKAYAAVMDLGEGGKPSALLGGGHYEDQYVKTADGWRIKRREFVASKTVLPTPAGRQGR